MSNAAPQRSSIFAGLLLILLGLIFLADRFYPGLGLGHLIRLYWPLLIILWGVAKLIDHLAARSGEPRPPILSGGEAALLVLLAFVLGAFVFRDWVRGRFPEIVLNLPAFGPERLRTGSLPVVQLPSGARVAIGTNAGDIKVTGIEGNQLRVNTRESMHVDRTAADQPAITIDHSGNTYRIHPVRRDFAASGGTVDLDISVPRAIELSMTTTKGDLSAAGIDGAVHAATTDGDITIRRAGADVSADLRSGDVRIDEIAGGVTVHGRGDDVDVENVEGDTAIDGEFAGDVRLHNVTKSVHIKSLRSDLAMSGLAGDLSIDSDDVSISNVNGPVKLSTRDKDIKVSNATDEMDLANTHGDIRVVYSNSPQHNLSVTDDSGDIDITLPANSYFELSAVSRSGEVECDFAQPRAADQDGEGTERLSGTFGTSKGDAPVPRISIATSYGTIHIRKSG